MKKTINIPENYIQGACSATEVYGAVSKISAGTPVPHEKTGQTQPAIRGRPRCPVMKGKEAPQKTSHGAAQTPLTKDAECIGTDSIPVKKQKKEMAVSDKIVAKALKGLLMKMSGFTLKETKTTYEKDGNGEKVVKGEIVTTKKVGPDLSAIVFALTNLDGRNWKSKPETAAGESDASEGDDTLDLSGMPEELLQALKKYADGHSSEADK